MSTSTCDLTNLTEGDELQHNTLGEPSSPIHDVIPMQTSQSDHGICDEDDQSEDDEPDDDYDTKPHQVTLLLNKNILRGCIRSRACLAAAYLCVTLLILAGLVALMVVAVMVAAPYHRVAGFIRTTCRVATVNWQKGHKQCSCGKGCSSVYPCLVINVIDIYRNTTEETMLYENELMLDRQCSYYPSCTSSRVSNENSVIHYDHLYGTRSQTYECFFNPDLTTEIIRCKKFHLGYVIQGLVWPSVFLLCNAALLFFLIKKKKMIILQSIYKP